MTFPTTRMRRLRSSPQIEELVSETNLRPGDFILPLFFNDNITDDEKIDSMPGVTNHPLSKYEDVCAPISESGVASVMVFGVPKKKDCHGTDSFSENGVVQRAIAGLKENSDLLVIADLCMCEYTDHGHCGIVENGDVDNDKTLVQYEKIAVSQAEAGADMIAPSGMMDGQVGAIRRALDDSGFKNIPIMAYSAKFCSSFYGPFRDAAGSSIGKGNRTRYQMQCGNRREAMREIELDISEGADIIMVKPAMAYLDVIHEARSRFDLPIAAYQVSGEYSMIKAAAQNGWLDEKRAMLESLLGIKRAGADMIITYYACEAAKSLR